MLVLGRGRYVARKNEQTRALSQRVYITCTMLYREPLPDIGQIASLMSAPSPANTASTHLLQTEEPGDNVLAYKLVKSSETLLLGRR